MNCATGDRTELVFRYAQDFTTSFTLWSAVIFIVSAYLSWKLWKKLPVSIAGVFPLIALFSLLFFLFRPTTDNPEIVVGADELCVHTGAATHRMAYKNISSIARMYWPSRRGSSPVLSMKLANGQTKEWPLPDLWGANEPQISDALNSHGIRLIKYRDDKIEP